MARAGQSNLQGFLKSMEHAPARFFTFGPFELDPSRLVLSLGGEPLALGPRVVETLFALVERAGEVVTKAELLERVWPNADVEEANLAQNVYVLRKVFRAHWTGRAIQTVPRRGYRFAASVGYAESTALAAPARPGGAWQTSHWGRVAALAMAGVATLALAVAAHGRGGPPPLSARGAESYQLGHYYWNQRTKDGFSKSLRYFGDVTHSDPQSPLGYAGLAAAYSLMPSYDDDQVPARVAMARASSYVRQALARDPRSSEAHAIAGYLECERSMNSLAGRSELERAIALDPHNASAHLWLGAMWHERGFVARGRAEFETAERLDPASPAACSGTPWRRSTTVPREQRTRRSCRARTRSTRSGDGCARRRCAPRSNAAGRRPPWC